METWYVMEDGSYGDPLDVIVGKDGKLHHKDGRVVAYAAHGPRSRSIDAEAERAKAKPRVTQNVQNERAKPERDEQVVPARRDMKPEEPPAPYKTR